VTTILDAQVDDGLVEAVDALCQGVDVGGEPRSPTR
jgi:hypothetical protein